MFGLARKSVTEGVNPLMVSVPDIKKYLVQSFEEIHSLEDVIQAKDAKIEEGRVIEQKYTAAMVVLSEKDRTIRQRDLDITVLTCAAADRDKRIADQDDLINTYRISEQNQAKRAEEAKSKIKFDVCANLVAQVDAIKGNIAKAQILELIAMEGKR